MIRIYAVSYFGSQDLPRYITSLRAQVYEDWELVVVDNSENEDEWRRIREATFGEPRIRTVRTPRNLGYLGAVRWSLGRDDSLNVSHVVVSNTDVRLAGSDALQSLSAMSAEGIGVMAPSIVSDRNGHDQNPYMIRRPTPEEMRRRRLFLGNPLTAQLAIILTSIWSRWRKRRRSSMKAWSEAAIYAAHGSFFILTQTFFAHGGNLDFPLFLFAEELFIAEQCIHLGLSVEYVPSIRVEHIEHGQMGYFRSIKLLRHGARAAKYGLSLIQGTDG